MKFYSISTKNNFLINYKTNCNYFFNCENRLNNTDLFKDLFKEFQQKQTMKKGLVNIQRKRL